MISRCVKMVVWGLLVLSAWPSAARAGRTFHVDPKLGKMTNEGSSARPWSTLEEVVAAGKIRSKDANGKVVNPAGAVRPGDTILLRTGYHGDVSISGAYNDAVITVAAGKDQRPTLKRLRLCRARKWTFRGLTVTPSVGPKYEQTTLVSLGLRRKTPCSELVIENSFIYSVQDSSKWSKADWVSKACNGISLGREGKGLIARGNYLLNVRFGINLAAPGSTAEGNTIENFSGDGIRAMVDDLTVQYNTIMNCYKVDKNHDDGIQCFLFNKGRGTVRRATVRGNIIINRQDPNQPHQGALQGIGFFDGPLIDFLVEKNVVLTAHWHGVSLYDAQNCKILNNAVYTRWTSEKPRPWIMLGQKQGLTKNNTVKGNIAHRFNLPKSGVDTADNHEVTEEAFYKRMKELTAFINKKYGPVHPVSNRPRIGKHVQK
ncbi:MAG: right-handed parallel beta-helix repeat-containing protein [Phycisphaerae bacterium]|nr:right-handed parallel beta-helix repeat-containing protein [Phycisphaerae bacterium]